MADITVIASKVAPPVLSKIASYLDITGWFLRKYYPFKMELFVPVLEFVPEINLNHDQERYELFMSVVMSNYSGYEVEVRRGRCDISFPSYTFVTVDIPETFILRQNKSRKLIHREELTPAVRKKALDKCREGEMHRANYSFSFSAVTRFGHQEIHCNPLFSAITIR